MPPQTSPVALAGNAIAGVKDLVERDLSEAFGKLRHALELLKPAFDLVSQVVKTTLVKSFELLRDAGLSLGARIISLGNAFASAGLAATGFTSVFNLVRDKLQSTGSVVTGILGGMTDKVGQYLTRFSDKVTDVFSLLYNKVKRPLVKLSTGFADSFQKVFPKTFGVKEKPETEPEKGGFGSLGKHAAPGTGANPFAIPEAAATGLEALGGAVGGAIAGVVTGIGALVGGIAVLGEAAVTAVQCVIDLGKQMAQFVVKASPGLVQLFNNALDDMMAVIGNALIPAFQIVTQVIRMVGDTLTTFVGVFGRALGDGFASLLPILRPIIELTGRLAQGAGAIVAAVMPAVTAIEEAIGSIFAALQPVFDLLIDLVSGAITVAFKSVATVIQFVLELVTPLIDLIGKGIAKIVKWIDDVFDAIAEFFGLEFTGKETKGGESTGAAAKSTSIGSVESVLATAQKNAFMLGNGAGSPAERTAGIAQKIHDLLKDWPEKLAKAIVDAMPGGETRRKIADLANETFLGGNGISGTGYKTGSRTVDGIISTTVALPVSGVVAAGKKLGLSSLNPFS